MGFGLTLQRFLEHLVSEPFVALQSVIHGVKDIIEILFFYFTELSLTALYVIPIVLVIRLLIRYSSKSYSYALWVVVYFKLISSFKLDFFNYSLVPQHKIDEIYTTITPNINTFYNPVAGFVSQVQSDFTAPVPVVTPMYIPALVWALGIGVIVAVSTMMYLTLYFETKNSGAECISKNIYVSDTIPTPFVYGVIRTKIFLPKGLTEAQQSYVITHEKVHISRGDHIIKLIAFAITCIHWFNPLVWLAFFLMEKDMEMSCDEKVIQLLGNEHKKDYSYCILSLASDKKFLPKGYLSFGDSDTKKRIKNVLGYKKPSFWVGVATVILVSFIALGLITDNNIAYRADISTTEIDTGIPGVVMVIEDNLTEDKNAGIVDSRILYVNDDDKRVVFREWDGIGNVRLEKYYSYHSDERLHQELIKIYEDGELSHTELYQYEFTENSKEAVVTAWHYDHILDKLQTHSVVCTMTTKVSELYCNSFQTDPLKIRGMDEFHYGMRVRNIQFLAGKQVEE